MSYINLHLMVLKAHLNDEYESVIKSRTVSVARKKMTKSSRIIMGGRRHTQAPLNKLGIISCLAHNSDHALVTSGGRSVWVDASSEKDNIGCGRTQEEG